MILSRSADEPANLGSLEPKDCPRLSRDAPHYNCIPKMSDALKCFRTITRCFIGRQVQIAGVTVVLPIAIASNPLEISINPGDKIEKVMTKSCDGREVIDFTYPKGSEPEIEMKFSMAVMELEALLHGRVVAPAAGTVEVMALAEFNSSAPPAARTTGVIGFSAIAQTAATTKAIASYIDPLTKVATKLAIKDTTATLAGDEISIGAKMAITVSAALAAKAVDIKAWIPVPVTGATVVTAEPLGLITIYAQGVDFDNQARTLSAKNCSRTESGTITSDPDRTIKLSILTDVTSPSGLGYDMVSVPLQNAC